MTYLLIFIGSILSSQTLDSVSGTYRDFDFWIGEWEVYRYGTDQLAGYNVIAPIIDSFALQETYHTSNGYKGTSINKYNPGEDRWEQYWVDNSGLTLHLTGGLVNGKMILSGSRNQNGQQVQDQIIWTPQEDGSVRQEWMTSPDNGTTWNKVFDGIYKKKP